MTVRLAAAHLSPIFLDAPATLAKALSAIEEAAGHGAQLLAFAESYLPGFPIWAALAAPTANHEWFKRLVAASVFADGPEIAALRDAARRSGIAVSFGFSERSKSSVGCLWNSNLLIDESGRVCAHHRKLVPTFYEKLVWAPGDGHGLRVAPLRCGNVGMLICGENTNPLARYSLLAQAEQIHVASWPPIWPTRAPSDRRNFDNLAANKARAVAHAFEAKCFVVSCAAYLDAATKSLLAAGDARISQALEAASQAASFFVGPTGESLGDLLRDEEGIAYADVDLDECVEPKQFHDLSGYYNRFDVFDLKVNRNRIEPVRFSDD